MIGGTSSANYASGHKAFNGLVFPSARRVYAVGADNLPLRDRVILSIDFHDIEVV
ncbi:MAG: hypothetical protein JOY60_01225 [Burkholderiaceae bacterium]|nr:hypothetical protein [Roseateles sp.]MBV8468471.1 hypothetical protein [Burkholderiaceae bacterium]